MRKLGRDRHEARSGEARQEATDRLQLDAERRHRICVDDDRPRAAPRPSEERLDTCDALALTCTRAAPEGRREHGEGADHG
jgi:hypothetical protein